MHIISLFVFELQSRFKFLHISSNSSLVNPLGFFFDFLKEWEHYIPVKRDLSDLIEKTKWCKDNYDKCLQIAENAYQFSKSHLTRNACYDKWNNIITSNY